MSDPKQGYLFLGGNARSGTTALARVLKCHPDVFMLVEQFLNDFLKKKFTADHMQPGSLFAEGSVLKGFELAEPAVVRQTYDQARLVGDKFPALYRGFDLLDAEFPGARLVYIVRNPFSVVASYDKFFENGLWKRDTATGIEEWNTSMRSGLDRCRAGKSLVIVPYEDLFQSEDRIRTLFLTLGLDPDKAKWPTISRILQIATDLDAKTEERNEQLRRQVSLSADFDSYRNLLSEFSIFRNADPVTATVGSHMAEAQG